MDTLRTRWRRALRSTSTRRKERTWMPYGSSSCVRPGPTSATAPLSSSSPEFLEWSGVAVAERRTRVARVAGRIVGFSTTAGLGPIAELEDLFVDPEWMRRGVGRRLVDDLQQLARRRGWSRIEVDANPPPFPSTCTWASSTWDRSASSLAAPPEWRYQRAPPWSLESRLEKTPPPRRSVAVCSRESAAHWWSVRRRPWHAAGCCEGCALFVRGALESFWRNVVRSSAQGSHRHL
jgi:GNAT superfamily N-acetyltransferase